MGAKPEQRRATPPRATWWKVVRTAGERYLEDKAMVFAAALAYYTSLSLAPLLLILVWLSGFVGPGIEDRMVEQIVALMGDQAGEVVELVVTNARSELEMGSFAGVAGLITLAAGASGVFAQLQTALNHIWGVEPEKSGILRWLQKRTLSLGMVLALGFLLLTSLFFNAAIAFVAGEAERLVPLSPYVWRAVNELVSLGLVILMFAGLFKGLPDARIEWRDVWFGAVTTAILFAVGKFAIGIYLGRSSVGSAYGAAGALIVLLVWVWFSAILFLFGGELTQARAELRGGGRIGASRAERDPG